MHYTTRTLKPLLLSLLGATLALSLGTAFWYRTALAEMIINAWQGYKLTDGLVGYWSFDAGDIDWTQNKAFDRSGQGNHGVFTNMATATAPVIGKLGQGIGFDGSNDYIDTGSAPAVSANGDWVISAWIYPQAYADGAQFEGNGTYFWDRSSATQGLSSLKAIGGKFAFQTRYDDGTGLDAVLSTSVIPLYEWTHVTVARRYNSQFEIYINGVFENSRPDSGGKALTVPQVRFAHHESLAYFNGKIDEARVYNRALSAEEVKRLYLMGNTFVTNASQNQKLTDGLVGLWSFDAQDIDWTQNKAFDRSGQGNHGTFTNMATATAPAIGKMGQGVSFDGSNDSIDMASSPNIDANGSFSYSLWVKPRSYVNGNSGTDAGTYFLDRISGSIVGLKAVNDKYCFQKGYDDGTSIGCVSTSENITLNEWAHIVLVRDYNSNFYIYRNGRVSGNVADTNKALSPDPPKIGNHASGARTTDGTIDDVRIYNRALSAEEVKRLYLMGGSLKINTQKNTYQTDGLTALWSFDAQDIDWSQNKALDRSSGANHGVFVNMSTTTSPTSGKIGQGIRLDKVDDYINLGTDTYQYANDFTYSAWVNTTGATADEQSIISTWGGRSQFRLESNATAGVHVFNGGDLQFYSAGSTGPLSSGEWHHLAAVKSSSGVGVQLYVDGVLAGTNSYTGNVAYVSGETHIGGRVYTGAENDNYFSGTIDDVRVYNRALSAEEVKRLYLMGK